MPVDGPTAGPTAGPTGDDGPLVAGSFRAWLTEVGAAIRGEADADVACGSCTACCTASQFVHVGPDETDALAHIPAPLRFAAPGLPRGHVLLGYDEHGRCPMLGDHGCTIYANRPRTCRTYDCRVFPATGVDVGVDGPTKAAIAARARRWRFEHDGDGDGSRRSEQALHGAADFLTRHRAELDDDVRPHDATQLAVTAVVLHDDFLAADGAVDPPTRTVADVVVALRSRRSR